MHGRKENHLIIIENGKLTSYALDDRNIWELGRPTKYNNPDIRLHSLTVSRRHGKFQNLDGVWFYLDYNGKNGTVYNRKHIGPGLNGRVKPVMLEDGDVFVFGGGEEAVINGRTIWGLFTTKDFGDGWRVAVSRGAAQLRLVTHNEATTLERPEKGTVIAREDGIAIYMGDLTYLTGDMELMDC